MDYNSDYKELKRYILQATQYIELAKNKSKKINEIKIYNKMKNIENILNEAIKIKKQDLCDGDKVRFKVLSKSKSIALEGFIKIYEDIVYLKNPESQAMIPYIYGIDKIQEKL